MEEYSRRRGFRRRTTCTLVIKQVVQGNLIYLKSTWRALWMAFCAQVSQMAAPGASILQHLIFTTAATRRSTGSNSTSSPTPKTWSWSATCRPTSWLEKWTSRRWVRLSLWCFSFLTGDKLLYFCLGLSLGWYLRALRRMWAVQESRSWSSGRICWGKL